MTIGKMPNSLSAQCLKLFEICQNPTTEQMGNIAMKVGCALSTAQRAFSQYKHIHPEIYRRDNNVEIKQESSLTTKTTNKKTVLKKLVNKIKGNKPEPIEKKRVSSFNKWALNKKKVILWDLPDKDLRDLFIKHVGFIGFYDKEGYAILDTSGEVHEGSSIPEPIDEITGEYMGIADYQADYIITYRDHFNILNIWLRGGGKTWVLSWIIELCMKYRSDNFLFFSLTDVAYKVANDVYVWGQNQGAVVDSDTVKTLKKVSGRKGSYQKFTFLNGSRYEVHQIRSSSTLGYHGWVIIMDDIIDEQHKRLPHLQKTLQLKWNSQYSKIRCIKLVMNNTRKFAGDFFDYIMDQFEFKAREFKRKKGYVLPRYLLHVSHKTPYTDLQFEGTLEQYRPWIALLEKSKLKYDTSKIISPWYNADDFEMMKLQNLKSFYAEMLGNPRPLEGGNWQRRDIRFKSWFEQFDYEAVCLAIDPAWTITETSDDTGMSIVGLKIALKEGRRQYTVFKGLEVKAKMKTWTERVEDRLTGEVGNVTHRGLLDIIEDQFQWILHNFTALRFITVIIETNSGGQVIVDVAKSESDNYEFANYLLSDEDARKLAYSKIKKNDRIDSSLYDTIKNGDMEFMDYLDNTIIIDQILTFPDNPTDHCLDSLAKGKTVLHKMKRADVAKATQRNKELVNAARRREEYAIIERFENAGIKGLRKPKKRGSMFTR